MLEHSIRIDVTIVCLGPVQTNFLVENFLQKNLTTHILVRYYIHFLFHRYDTKIKWDKQIAKKDIGILKIMRRHAIYAPFSVQYSNAALISIIFYKSNNGK